MDLDEGSHGPGAGWPWTWRKAELASDAVSPYFIYELMRYNNYNCSGAPPQGELNRGIFPIEMPSSDTNNPHMKYPPLTLQLLGFLIRALFLRKGLQ
jgi:hypothetical protein